MYNVDVLTYHYDNDRFEFETKVLRFTTINEARQCVEFLESLEYEADDLCVYWGRKKGTGKSAAIPGGYATRHWVFGKLDVWHGCVVETEWQVYSVEAVKTYY